MFPVWLALHVVNLNVNERHETKGINRYSFLFIFRKITYIWLMGLKRPNDVVCILQCVPGISVRCLFSRLSEKYVENCLNFENNAAFIQKPWKTGTPSITENMFKTILSHWLYHMSDVSPALHVLVGTITNINLRRSLTRREIIQTLTNRMKNDQSDRNKMTMGLASQFTPRINWSSWLLMIWHKEHCLEEHDISGEN